MSQWLTRWSGSLEKESGGRIAVKRFPGSQMGPVQQHYDYARTGQADVVWFLHGATPGRFQLTEIVQVPYLIGSAEIGTKVLNDPPTGGEGLFLIAWLVAWNIIGPLFTFFWLWNIAGREIVTLEDEALTVRYALGPSGWTRRFDRREVTDLRVSPPATADFRSLAWWPGGGTIAFDYGARTNRFGGGLDEAEAKQIVADFRRRLEPPEPF